MLGLWNMLQWALPNVLSLLAIEISDSERTRASGISLALAGSTELKPPPSLPPVLSFFWMLPLIDRQHSKIYLLSLLAI